MIPWVSNPDALLSVNLHSGLSDRDTVLACSPAFDHVSAWEPDCNLEQPGENLASSHAGACKAAQGVLVAYSR